MGGGSVVSHDHDSSLEEDFPLLSSHSAAVLRDDLGLQDEDNRINENELDVGETGEGSIQPSSGFDFEVNERKRLSAYQEIMQSYDESKIDSMNLKEAKEKILSYSPGAWLEKVGGLQLCDYDIPKTTCLMLVGPRASGKSSLINRISKVLEDDKFAPARAQVSYNSLIGDGTYFLQEYMIPRNSTSICLCDTRSFSCNSHENDNNRILKNWMTKGVRHGELVVRNTDSQILKKSLKCKAHNKGFSSNDKPVLVFTHGDLLSFSDRARVSAHLGDLLGIPPTKQIFDIPECDEPVTESTIIEMLQYSLEHAERNFPQKRKVLNKVHKTSLSLCMILLILGIGVAIALAYNKFTHPCHASLRQACSKKDYGKLPKLKLPEMELKIDWPKIRHIW